MGEIRLFQICFEGDLTAEVSHVMRRLGADANFDQSWQVFLPEGRHSAALVRYLRASSNMLRASSTSPVRAMLMPSVIRLMAL